MKSRIRTTTEADYNREILADMRSLICGEKISSGAFREVFEHAYNPRWVVKVQLEDDGRGPFFCNAVEWELWNEVRNTDFKKWFAPCHHISQFGLVLIQEKCEPILKKNFPTEMPDIFADIGLNNWGILKGQPVCFDYGITNLAKVALRKTRIKKV